MAVRKSLSQVKKNLSSTINKAGEYWLDKQPADMGNYSGTVVVPGTTNMVYVRLSNGQVVQAFNSIAPNIYNWKVFVGRDKSQPNLLKVTEVRWIYNISQTIAYVLFHHLQHEYPGPDTVWIQRDQFMPLLVLPNGGFHIRLYGDVIYTSTMAQPIRLANIDDIDLSAYVMATGAHYILMEVLPNGTINYVVGSSYGSKEILRATAPFPTPSIGSFPIAVIEFYEGQTELRRDSTVRNIIDLRMFTSAADVGAGYQWHTASAMTTPIDTDEYGIWDVTNNVLKKITSANVRASMFKDAEGDPAAVVTTSAADGTSTYAARRDHVHTFAQVRSRIVMDVGSIDPPVPVLTPDGDDYVYYDL